MYFWRIAELKRDSVARPLTEREQLPYLLAFAIFSSACLYLPIDPSNVWDVLGVS